MINFLKYLRYLMNYVLLDLFYVISRIILDMLGLQSFGTISVLSFAGLVLIIGIASLLFQIYKHKKEVEDEDN